MPKHIVKRSFNGHFSNLTNTPGGHISSSENSYAANNIITITDSDLDTLYNSFIKPFIAESPFYMGSMDLLTTIYSHLNTLIDISPSNKTKLVLEVFRDILTILVQTRDIYFNNLKLTNEANTLRVKYQISSYKILDLTEQLAVANKASNTNKGVFSGSVGIVLKQPKNLIYAQAVLNIYLAWYQYLHNSRVVDPRLYISTKQYVSSLGTKTDAYNKLIQLLDEKFITK